MIILDLVFIGGAAAIWAAAKAGTRRAWREDVDCKEADAFIDSMRDSA